MRHLLSLLLAALLLPPAAQPATGVLAVGDFGVGGASERLTAAAIMRYEAAHPARLLVTLGDNDYSGSSEQFSINWTAAFGWLGEAGVAVAGSLGNHDWELNRGRYQYDELGMPEAYYTRRVGKTEIFLLNSNAVGPTQTRWLREALASSTAEWKVAAFHHPPFSCGAHRGDPLVQAKWVPLFDRYGVDLVLSGHDHNYQRFAPKGGVTYVVHGGGGQRLVGLRPCPVGYPRLLEAQERFGFLSLSVDGRRLEVRAINRAGTTVDRFVLRH